LNFCREPGLSTRQRNHFFLKKIFLKIVFAEWYHLTLGKIDLFAECQAVALGKTGEVAVFAAFFSSFAECHTPGTRQRLLCPVLALGKVGKFAIFFCLLLSFESKHAKLIYNK